MLTPARKGAYALGDVTVNCVLASLSLVYASYFLTQVAGLRPALAGLVPLIGRAVDAFTDPAMGRLTDLTRWRAGRRRPWFLIGALPFGASFALLWWDLPTESQATLFLYYSAVYCALSVSMTVLAVPYLAIQPEMALGYDERTALNTWRTVGSVMGILAAVGIRPLAEALGGGGAGFTSAGALFGVGLALPWLAVHRATFERPGFRARAVQASFLESLRTAMRHRSFTQLTAIYLLGRIAIDLIAALLILYVTYWVGRSDDFELVMLTFILTNAASLPLWLRFARGRDKAGVFMIGATWWMASSLGFLVIQPDWPREALVAIAAFGAVGYAAVDLMPFAMLGEAIDEDDLETGERREGLYYGVFTFLRKLAGAAGVFGVLAVLDLAGFEKAEEQSETVRQTIRFLTAIAPVLFLALAILAARRYPLTRAVHDRILRALRERDAAGEEAGRR